jgi:dienelactone hydrolase
MAHGTQVQQVDMKNCKAPVSLICVEDDPWFPDEIREAGKKDMEQEGRVHELEMYPGVPHGFAVVGEYEEEHIREAQKKAFTQMVDWLKAH